MPFTVLVINFTLHNLTLQKYAFTCEEGKMKSC